MKWFNIQNEKHNFYTNKKEEHSVFYHLVSILSDLISIPHLFQNEAAFLIYIRVKKDILHLFHNIGSMYEAQLPKNKHILPVLCFLHMVNTTTSVLVGEKQTSSSLIGVALENE